MPCRLFLALHETYGPAHAWQFWYLLVAMPADEEALAQDGAFAEQSSEQVMKAFEQVWGGMAVRFLAKLRVANMHAHACPSTTASSRLRRRVFCSHHSTLCTMQRNACRCTLISLERV